MKNKIYVCGTLPRIYDTNYYERKCQKFINKYKIVFVYDDTIFFDEKEYKFLPNNLNKEKNKKYEKYLIPKIKKQCYRKVKIISWHSLVKNNKKILNFLINIDNNSLQIDLIKCPICKKQHIGPFKINNRNIKLPCGIINLEKINHKFFRIKKGYLQFLVGYLTKGKVLLNEKYYLKNKDLIIKLNLSNLFIINEKRNNNLINYDIKVIIINGKHKNNLEKIIILRHFFKKHKIYFLSDFIRKNLMKKGYIINDYKNKYVLKKVKNEESINYMA